MNLFTRSTRERRAAHRRGTWWVAIVAMVLVACAASASSPAPGPAPDPARDRLIADFAERLARDVETDSVGSVAAAVVANGEVVWEGAFGVADASDGTAATPQTIYRAASISKMVAGLLLMRLAEQGVVALDDPVTAYVPEVHGLAGRRATDRAMTLEDLATHTAGLAREPARSRAGRGSADRWDRKVVASIPLTESRMPPGEEYHYSNIGYGVLGLALERAAGRPFEELVSEHVLEPLGMTSSFYQVPRRERARLAAGYVNLDDGTVDPRVPRAEHRGRGYRLPGEGLYATAGDLARLAMVLTGNGSHVLLNAASREALLADHSPEPDGRTGYGIGVQLTRIGGALLAGHSGRMAGYTAYLAVDVEAGTGVVVLRNYNRGATNLVAEAHRLLLDLRESAEGGSA